MALRRITAPTTEPVSLIEIKNHLRVDFEDDDTVITNMAAAARVHVETTELSSALISQTWELVMSTVPSSCITLPLPPLQSVTSITFTDVDAVATVVSASAYLVDADSWPGRIVLKDGQSWPSVNLRKIGGVVVRFVAGYGNTGADVPMPIRQAILLITGDLYENREETVFTPGQTGVRLPYAARQLLASYRKRSF